MTNTTHENFSHEESVVLGSDRSFGIVMTAGFALLALINGWHDGRVWPWTAGLASVFLAITIFYPRALNPLNRLWFKFGLLLHRIVNPIMMAFIFFGAVLPTGLAMRALGKDLLRLKYRPEANSYWVERHPAGPTPESMKDQF
jgi:hypothetical protein